MLMIQQNERTRQLAMCRAIDVAVYLIVAVCPPLFLDLERLQLESIDRWPVLFQVFTSDDAAAARDRALAVSLVFSADLDVLHDGCLAEHVAAHLRSNWLYKHRASQGAL
jgi:hypothetical protein